MSDKVRPCLEHAFEADAKRPMRAKPNVNPKFLAFNLRRFANRGMGDGLSRRTDMAAILDNTPFLFTRCSSNLRYLFVSEAYARMVGRRPEDLEGKSIREVMGNAGFRIILPFVRRVLRGEAVECESEVDFKGIGTRRLIAKYAPDRDKSGNIRGWVATILDVTDKHKAAQAAADLEAMTTLQEIGALFVRKDATRDECLQATIDTAIKLVGADKGNLLLLNKNAKTMDIVAQRGLSRPFLTFLEQIGRRTSTCGAAAMRRQVVVEDIVPGAYPFHRKSQQILIDEGVRAVASTPLVSSNGGLMGTILTHYSNCRRPTDRELSLINLLGRQAADYLERKQAEQIEKTLLDELDHRCSNLLSVVQAIAHYTFGAGPASEAFRERLQALARSNRSLLHARYGKVDLGQIARAELGVFANRARLIGDAFMLDPEWVQKFTLLLHELVTNAAKYGAFSNANGIVVLSWATERSDERAVLKFHWQEDGGPAVERIHREGFGTKLMKTQFPAIQLVYEKAGLRCLLNVPIDDRGSSE